MSEWDFLWELSGEELMDAMASGGTKEDWDYIERQEKRKRSEKSAPERVDHPEKVIKNNLKHE